MTKYLLPFLLFFCWIGGMVRAQTAALPTPEQARDTIVNARKGITSCVIELEQTSASGGSSSTPNKRTWRIWWDDKHQRTDYTPSTPEPSNRIVHCINCEKNGWGLVYHEEKNLLATLKPVADYEKGAFHLIRDPRLFGHSFGGLSQSDKGIQRLFAQQAPTVPKVTVIPGPDGDLWQIRWTYDDPDISFTITADPNRGFEVTAIESKGKDFRESLRTVLKRWDKTWYPERITFEQWFGDKRTAFEEVVIKSASFNQPIPPETFTLAGVKMLPGHPIRVDDKLRIEQVDDGKIGPLESDTHLSDPTLPPSAAPVRVADPAEWHVNPWLLAAAGIIVVAAVVLLVHRFRTRRSPS